MSLRILSSDGFSLLFEAHEVSKCGVLEGCELAGTDTIVPVPLTKAQLQAWQGGTEKQTNYENLLYLSLIHISEPTRPY